MSTPTLGWLFEGAIAWESAARDLYAMLTGELLADPERQDFLLTQLNDHLERLKRFSREFKQFHRRMIHIRRVALRPG